MRYASERKLGAEDKIEYGDGEEKQEKPFSSFPLFDGRSTSYLVVT
jgi:hypothetical protein